MIKSLISVFDRNTFLHLRLPFSFFLLPVYLFSLSQVAAPDYTNALLIFTALHFFIYPGSNTYNSFMDKDTGSIGGLEHPPPVSRKLYHASILLDAAGLLMCVFIHPLLIPLMLIYVGVSKAYSWHGIRLKKYPFSGWLVVILFQGAYTYLLVSASLSNTFSLQWMNLKNLEAMLLASLLIGGYYPLTQIYQHGEDASRGDRTLSLQMGIKGTFIFSALVFLIAFAVATHFFLTWNSPVYLLVFALSLLPAFVYFLFWAVRSFQRLSEANFRNAMRMTAISSTCMNAGFLIMCLMN